MRVQASNDRVVGRITAIKGEVLIFHKDETRGIQAKIKDLVYQYDTIQTMKDSQVQIIMEDDSLLNLSENAKIHFKEYYYAPEENLRSAVINLVNGKCRFLISKLFTARDSKFQVNTSTSVIGVRDTHFIVWVVSPELTTVITLDGTVIAKNISETLICESAVKANYACEIALNKCPTSPILMPAEEIQKILMDTQLTPTPPSEETPATLKDTEEIGRSGSEEKVGVSGKGDLWGILPTGAWEGISYVDTIPPIPQSVTDNPSSPGYIPKLILPAPPGTPK